MHKQLILSTPAYTRSIHSCVRQRPSTTNPTSATLLTRPNRRDSDLRISQTTTNAQPSIDATQADNDGPLLHDLHRSAGRADRAQAQARLPEGPRVRRRRGVRPRQPLPCGNSRSPGRAHDRIYGTGVLAVTATPGTPSPGVRGSTARKLVLGDCTKRNPDKSRHPNWPADTCECRYHWYGLGGVGCKISDAVDFPGCACKCTLGFLSCTGVDANCKDPDSDACKNPDKSYASCEQGGGDCGGYPRL